MKRLRTILQHNFIYYVLLAIVLVSYFINSNLDYVSVYDSFDEEEFIISNIIEKDYGLKLELKGKEKVLGFLYLDEKSEINNFLGEYTLGDKVLVSGEISDVTNNTVPNTFNYKGSNVVNLTIKPADITLTADSYDIKYSEDNPKGTYKVTSGKFYNDDESLSNIEVTLEESDNYNVGTYDYVITATNNNYN